MLVLGQPYNAYRRGWSMNKIFKLCFYGIEESEEFDCRDLSEDEINAELVNWVLDRVDHWVEEEES